MAHILSKIQAKSKTVIGVIGGLLLILIIFLIMNNSEQIEESGQKLEDENGLKIISLDGVEGCFEWKCTEWAEDENGLKMYDYKNLLNLGIGKVYNPNFVNNTNWYMNNYEDKGDYFLIPYNYDWYITCGEQLCIVEKPFYSCEAQTYTLVTVGRTYQETLDQKYLEFGNKILNSLKHPPFAVDGWYVSLYHPNLEDPYILNSQIKCVMNLFEYYNQTGNEEALKLFDKGVNRLEQEIDWYTVKGGTIYDKLSQGFKSHDSHPEYAKELLIVAKYADSDKLLEVYKQWTQN